MRKLTVSSLEAGQRLDRMLTKYMALAPKSFFYKMLRKKNITLNGKKAEGMEKLEEGDEVTLYLAEETIEKFQQKQREEPSQKLLSGQLDIIYEDEDLLIINKPAGMLSQKAAKEDISVIEYVTEYLIETKAVTREQMQTFRPGICNRLDRNTSGLLAAGKRVQGLQWMNRLFRERDLKKYYLCIVRGRIETAAKIEGYLEKDHSHNKVIISSCPEKGTRIETEYDPLDYGVFDKQEYTLLKVHLITGKSHQIRAHLDSIGHPIVGDGKYGRKDIYHRFKKEFGLCHQLLHAWQLQFGSPDYLPSQYHEMKLEAPVPELFETIMDGLGMHRKERG